jgi:hypothetical protein
MKPEGTVSLPDMQVLYEGFPNKVRGVASGYDQTSLSGSGVTLSKTGDIWIAKPNPGTKKCSISISGKNSATNKTANLGSFEFKVKPLPPAAIYLVKVGNGGSVPKTAKGLSAAFPPEIDLTGVNFTILSWTLDFLGKTVEGPGTLLNDEATRLLSQGKKGQMVTIGCKYSNGSKVMFGGLQVRLQ